MKRFVCLVSIGFILSLSLGCVVTDRDRISGDNMQSATAANIEDIYLPPRKDFRLVVISDLNSQYGSTEYEVGGR